MVKNTRGSARRRSDSDASFKGDSHDPSSPDRALSVSSSSDSEFEIVESKAKPKRKATSTTKRSVKKSKINLDDSETTSLPCQDIEDCRPHAASHHSVKTLKTAIPKLLEWFESIREKRQMPWRKPYDPSLTLRQKGQRAYEIWVSEVMLQQTQVTTVIPYWKRWMEKWPTILDLAKADLEEVNAAWRGLGYYRRAKNLLLGSQRIAGDAKYDGRLPEDPARLEKEVEGVGRYTAGAICSMAYGVKTPIVSQ